MAELWQKNSFRYFTNYLLNHTFTFIIGVFLDILAYLIGVNVLSLIFGLDLLKYKVVNILVLSGVYIHFENILLSYYHEKTLLFIIVYI